MDPEFAAFFANVFCTIVSLVLLIKTWRRDVFFAAFFFMLTLYSIVPMWGYLLYPEISGVVLRMYFEVWPLVGASLFTAASAACLYLAFRFIYTPFTKNVAFQFQPTRSKSGLVLAALFLYVATLAVTYLQFRSVLSYSNASDEQFLESAGIAYKVFWQLYKTSTFIVLILYALVRSRVHMSGLDRKFSIVLLAVLLALYILITLAVGSRTDPLALTLGLIAYEYYFRRTAALETSAQEKSPRSRLRFFIFVAGFLLLVGVALTVLEISRSGGELTRDDLEVSGALQSFLLKDYYWPFHVLIGAIAHNYIDPLSAIASNLANSLMFLGVDYLQYFVVEQWNPGGTTRTASPAIYAFTEGYVVMGWLGPIYNGIVWAMGIGIWRLLSRSNNEPFNAVAYAICVAMAANVARSQSSYFIKDIYILFLPILYLYAASAGLTLRRRSRLAVSPASAP